MATVDNYVLELAVKGTEEVESLNKKLETFGKLILGIGIAEFGHKVLELGDHIQKLNDATGLSVEGIANFQNALMLSGGRADEAGKMIAKFFQIVDEGAKGADTALRDLQKAGVTFSDLGKLSEEELLNKAVKNLGEMEAGAARTAAGIALFGKAFRSVAATDLAEALGKGDFSGITKGIKEASEMADKLENNMYKLQLAATTVFGQLITLLEPFVGKVNEGNLTLEQSEKIVQALGIAVLAVGGAMALAFGAGMIGNIIKFNEVLGVTAAISNVIGASPVGAIAKIAAALTTAAVAGGATYLALDQIMKKNNELSNAPEPGVQNQDQNATNQARVTSLYTADELKARQTALQVAMAQTDTQQKQFELAQNYQRVINTTIGMEQTQAEITKSNASLTQAADNQILALEKQINDEKAKGYMVGDQLKGVNEGLVTQYKQQIDQVKQNLEVVKKLKEEEILRVEAIKAAVAGYQLMNSMVTLNSKTLEEDRTRDITMQEVLGIKTKEQGDRRIAIIKLETEANDRLNQLRLLYAQQAVQGNMIEAASTLQMLDLEKERFAARIKNLEQTQALEDRMRESSIAGAQAALFKIARSTDPFTLMESRFTKVFDNVGSALDKLVDTGKLSFSDLANSIIRDLIKIELRAAASNFLSSAAGWLGFGVPGKAAGGDVDSGQPYMVGEKGPELFIPKMAGTIVPNGQIGSTSSSSSSPTPIGGNTITNHYYTVNAVDAKSVAQLFAENRKTLLGSVMMAQKEMPYKTR
jgi:hypothetical protein